MAVPAVPTFGTNGVVPSSYLAQLATAVSWLFPVTVRKTADKSLASNTTLQDDDALFVPAVASATYLVGSFIIYEAGTVGDLKVGLSGPSGATLDWNISGAELSTTTSTFWGANTISGTDAVGGRGAGANTVLRPGGIFITSTTPGNLTFRWCQNTSDATATIVKANSVLFMQRIG